MHVRAIMLREPGGPEALRLEEIPVGNPARNELRIRHEAIGVNFHDIYVRSGLYSTLPLPGIPGLEAAGKVIAVGEGVKDFRVGDRIAYLDSSYGGYAEERLVDASLAVPLPDGISSALAATVLLKGLTAIILATRVHRVTPGQRILVHAAAGGVGRLLTKWLAHIGAEVVGTVGSEKKAEVARANGCSDVILYRSEDFVARVTEITGGKGVDVVFDSVGRDTFNGSLASLALRGHLVNFGQSSGPVPAFEISRLAIKSASVTRAAYSHYIENRGDLLTLANTLWSNILNGTLQAEVGTEFALDEAAAAHHALEGRIKGPIILIP